MFLPFSGFTPWLVWGLCSLAELPKHTRFAQDITLSYVECHRAGRRWHAGWPAKWHLAQALLHRTFSWLATFNGCSLGLAETTCSIEKKSPMESNGAELYLVGILGLLFRGPLRSKLVFRDNLLCVCLPSFHLCSSGGFSCRTDSPCSLLLVLPTYVFKLFSQQLLLASWSPAGWPSCPASVGGNVTPSSCALLPHRSSVLSSSWRICLLAARCCCSFSSL